MRGLVLALLLVGPAIAGCIGDTGEIEEDPGTVQPLSRPVDYSQPADQDPGSQAEDPVDNGSQAPELPPLTTLQADPTAPGPLTVDRGFYDFGWTVVTAGGDAGQGYPAQLNGSIHYPTSGQGPFPVVVLQHGRHGTCYLADGSIYGFATHVCPDAQPVSQPIPSFTGYAYLAETLASHGYVVASVNANQVNDRDLLSVTARDFVAGTGTEVQVNDWGTQARAQIVLRTLDGLATVDGGEDPGQPAADNSELVQALKGQLDMETIGLMGHSRGGEGVTYAITYNQDRVQGSPHAIEAVFALAPIDPARVRAPDVAFATLLPYCDGDVSSLSGAIMYDDSRYLDEADPAPKHQFVAMGANHNFYNTVWEVDGDDAGRYDDPFCGEFRQDGGGRLNGEDQRRHGEALINGFFLTYLGGAEAFTPWLEGATLPPGTACPGAKAPCPGLVHTSYQPVPEDRIVIESVADGQATTTNDLGGPILTDGGLEAKVCQPGGCPDDRDRQNATQVTLTWDAPGNYTLGLPEGHRVLSGYDAVAFRTGVNTVDANEDLERQQVDVLLEDGDGTVASVAAERYSQALFYPPGGDNARLTLSAVRIPLEAFSVQGVDLGNVASVTLQVGDTPSGSIQVADIMVQR